MMTPVNQVIKRMMHHELTMALAESITCGLATHQFTTVKGTSAVLRGSLVCYHSDVKTNVLGVSRQLIRKHTAESQVVTDQMARKLSKLIDADLHVAITGLASSDGSENRRKPVGTVYLAIFFRKKLYQKRSVFRGEPLTIRKKASAAVCEFILEVLDKNGFEA